ncbi:hypothetical protein pb186bvf_004639 [Paramecium bursaria]
MTCLYSLSGNTTVGGLGAITFSFSTPNLATLVDLQSTSTWSIDTITSIQSVNFACSNSNNQACSSQGSFRWRCQTTTSTTSIACSGINNPTFSGETQGSFTLNALNSGATQIDTCSVSVTGYQPGTLNLTQTLYYPFGSTNPSTSLTVNQRLSARIRLYTVSNLLMNDNIRIQISQFYFTTTQSSGLNSNGDAFLKYAADFSQTSNGQLTFTFQDNYSPTDLSTLTITLNQLQVYYSCIQHTITIFTYRGQTNRIIDQLSVPISFTPTPGQITLNTIQPDIFTVNTIANYQMFLTIQNVLSSTGYITIGIPTTLSYPTTQSCYIIIGTTNSTISCSQSGSNIKFQLTQSLIAQTFSLQFRLTNVALSSLQSQFISVITYYDSTPNQVDQSINSLTVQNYIPAVFSNIQTSTTSTTVGAITNLIFQFVTINQILSGSSINIQVPTETQLQNSNQCLLNTVSYQCQFIASSNQQGVLSNIFTSDFPQSTNIVIQIQNCIRTPFTLQPTTANQFNFELFTNLGVAEDRKYSFGQLTMTQTSSLNVYLKSRISTKNGDLTSYTFTFQFLTQQPLGTIINLSMPNFAFGTLQITGYTFQYIATNIQITLPSIQAAGISQDITIQNIYNPISLEPSTTLQAYTQFNSFGVSTFTGTLQITNTLSGTITGQMTQQNGILDETDTYQFTFQVTNPLSYGFILQINIPTQFTYNPTNCMTTISGTIGFTAQSCSYTNNQLSIIMQSVIVVTNYQMSISQILNPQTNSAYQFQISTLKNNYLVDQSLATDTNLQFAIKCQQPCRTCDNSKCLSCYTWSLNPYYSNNQCLIACPQQTVSNNFICQSCTQFCLTCTTTACSTCQTNFLLTNGICNPTVLTIISITPDTKVVNTQSTYTIVMATVNTLTSTGYIRVSIPNTLTFVAGQQCTLIVNSVISNLNCFVDTGFVKVQLNSQLTPQTFTLGIKFTNVVLSNQVAIFTQVITYLDTTNAQVDSYTGSITVTGYIPAIFSAVQVSVSSLIVGQVSDLTFTFTTYSPLQANSQALINIPTECALQTTTLCLINSVTVNCQLTMTTSQSGTLTLSNSLISSNTLIQLVLQKAIRNPFTLKPTLQNQFSLQFYTSDGIQQDYLLNFGQLTMTQTSNLQVSLQSRTSTVNGALSQYTFSFQFGSQQPQGSILALILPGFTFGQIQVTGYTFNYISNSIFITLPLLSQGSVQNIILQNIYNPISLSPSQNLQFYTTTSELYSISQFTGNLQVTNTLNNLITSSVTNLNGILGENDTFTFTFSVTNPLSNNCIIILTIPTQFQIISTQCLKSVSNTIGFTLSSCNYISQGISMVITSIIQTTQYQFQITNIQNPSTFNTLYFQLSTYDSNSFLMDQSQANNQLMQFTLKCNLPCRTCSNNNCLSCYSPLNLHNQGCIQYCPQRFYSSNLQCIACTQNCLQCSSTQCTQCDTSYIIQNGVCQLVCPDGQFIQQDKCITCDPNCVTCQQTSKQCLTCLAGAFLFQNSCMTSCPTNFYFFNNNCILCQSPCRECTTSAFSCSNCITGYFLKQSVCVQDCGAGYFQNGLLCSQCVYPCNTCSSATICLDCSQSKGSTYYHQGNCLTACPSEYYPQNQVCSKCDSSCTTCTQQSLCTGCPLQQVLVSGKCLNSCATGTFQQNQSCINCNTSCLECTSLTNCQTCQVNTYNLQGQCISSCPNKYYTAADTCIACDQSCQTCDSNGCLTCPLLSYMLNKLCVTKCPSNYFISDPICQECDSSCLTCNASGCLTCPSNLLIYKVNCVVSCPTGYYAKSQSCLLLSSDEQQVLKNLQGNDYIPVPFSIGLSVVSLIVIAGKIQKSETHVAGSLLGFTGTIILGSQYVLYVLYNKFDLNCYILLGAGGFLAIFNLVNLIQICVILKNDIDFLNWIKENLKCQFSYSISVFFSIPSFTATRLLFCKFFGFEFFSARIENISKLTPFHVVNGLAVLFYCAPASISSAMIAYSDNDRGQLFISAIDCFIVSVIQAILMICETQKDGFIDLKYLKANVKSFFAQGGSEELYNNPDKVDYVNQSNSQFLKETNMLQSTNIMSAFQQPSYSQQQKLFVLSRQFSNHDFQDHIEPQFPVTQQEQNLSVQQILNEFPEFDKVSELSQRQKSVAGSLSVLSSKRELKKDFSKQLVSEGGTQDIESQQQNIVEIRTLAQSNYDEEPKEPDQDQSEQLIDFDISFNSQIKSESEAMSDRVQSIQQPQIINTEDFQSKTSSRDKLQTIKENDTIKQSETSFISVESIQSKQKMYKEKKLLTEQRKRVQEQNTNEYLQEFEQNNKRTIIVENKKKKGVCYI